MSATHLSVREPDHIITVSCDGSCLADAIAPFTVRFDIASKSMIVISDQISALRAKPDSDGQIWKRDYDHISEKATEALGEETGNAITWKYNDDRWRFSTISKHEAASDLESGILLNPYGESYDCRLRSTQADKNMWILWAESESRVRVLLDQSHPLCKMARNASLQGNKQEIFDSLVEHVKTDISSRGLPEALSMLRSIDDGIKWGVLTTREQRLR